MAMGRRPIANGLGVSTKGGEGLKIGVFFRLGNVGF